MSIQKALSYLRQNDPEEAAAELIMATERTSFAVSDEVLSLIHAGLIPDAVNRLERFTDPKWKSFGQCQAAYDAAMYPDPTPLTAE
jgi:hypothetical protein